MPVNLVMPIKHIIKSIHSFLIYSMIYLVLAKGKTDYFLPFYSLVKLSTVSLTEMSHINRPIALFAAVTIVTSPSKGIFPSASHSEKKGT